MEVEDGPPAVAVPEADPTPGTPVPGPVHGEGDASQQVEDLQGDKNASPAKSSPKTSLPSTPNANPKAAVAAASSSTPASPSSTVGDQQPQAPPSQALSQDICRVCRCEASTDRPLFHPCICTGSIKYIHQECLLQWLRYSKKEFCELCNHRFSFTPIYSPDMPSRLPIRIVLSGFLSTVAHAVRFWLHYTLVALAWLGVVPLTACRIYRTLFTGSVANILSLPIDVLSTDNITADILQGCAVVTLTLLAFIGLVWLREQILHGGGPEWLEAEFDHHHPDVIANDEREGNDVAEDEEGEDEDEDDSSDDDVDEADNLPAEPEGPPGEDNFANNNNNNQQQNEANLGDEGQWNPMEWDRGAEELTWERLLGLDGSLVFLEHVFWVVSLNTLFILVFAFCPYHIGHFTVVSLKMKPLVSGAHFEGMLITLCGYCVIAFILVILHGLVAVLRFRKTARILGLCYVVVKVSLLLVIEIVAFPVICGWWLDICSLALFDATLKDRQASYHNAPMASVFIHWLVGMVYVFYFASFVILLREVLRPGVLWFLRNLNDPDFNPIQEMIHLSIARHVRRFLASLVMFGTTILVMLYVPSRIIKHALPNFLPYQTSQLTESQVDELAMELMLLLVIIPAVQDQNHTREWLKALIRGWCSVAAWVLDLRSYLFGDVPIEEHDESQQQTDQRGARPPELDNNPIDDRLDRLQGGGGADGQLLAQRIRVEVQVPLERRAPPAPAPLLDDPHDLAGPHQALLPRDVPTNFQAYNKPDYFPLRITGLLFLTVISWLAASLATMLIPVCVGRQIFKMALTDANSRVYELYTAATGVYVCLLAVRAATMVTGWVQQGWAQLSAKIKEWTVTGVKAGIALFLLVGVIPLLFGFLLELVALMPVRVPLHQSPVFFPWQDWALGAMYTKISVALTFMGPEWWMKAAIERLYQDGVRNLNLSFLIPKLVVPVCTTLGLALALPYVTAHSLAPLVISDPTVLISIQRRIYPFLLLLFVIGGVAALQLRQFRKLYEHIKNDRYLVGRRLVNYNHPNNPQAAGSNGN